MQKIFVFGAEEFPLHTQKYHILIKYFEAFTSK